MAYEKSIEQLKSLIEHFNNGGNDFNATDIEAIKYLLKENQKLKQKYLNAVADYETTMAEKEQLNSLVNSCQEEIRQLKKQLEEREKDYFKLSKEVTEYTMKLHKNKVQQKEFIKYLEDEKVGLFRDCSQIYEDSLGKIKLVNEDIFKEVNNFLQKYKKIIEVSDGKEN